MKLGGTEGFNLTRSKIYVYIHIKDMCISRRWTNIKPTLVQRPAFACYNIEINFWNRYVIF